MILKRITKDNLRHLKWFDTIYFIAEPISDYTESPKVIQILPFFQVKYDAWLIYDNYYYSDTLFINY
jgi:hypothetical protein